MSREEWDAVAAAMNRDQAEQEARQRYLEHRVSVLERHRDALAVFLAGSWVALILYSILEGRV